MSIDVSKGQSENRNSTQEVSESDAKALGAALQLYRLAKGLSRKEVCSELKSPINEQYLYLIESGRRKPRPALLQELCSILEVDPMRLTATAQSTRMRAASRIAAQIAKLEHRLEQLLNSEGPKRSAPRRSARG